MAELTSQNTVPAESATATPSVVPPSQVPATPSVVTQTQVAPPSSLTTPASAPATSEAAPASAPDTLLGDLYQSAASPETPQEPVVPESYNFDGIQLKNSTFLEQDKELASNLGKALGLTNDQARKLLESGDELLTNNLQAKLQQNVNMWKAQIAADPELGGSNYETTRTNLARVIKRYASQEALEVLDRSGIGAHPAIVRMLNKMGNDLGQEQRFVQGSQPQAPKKSPLRALYPNSPELKFGDE